MSCLLETNSSHWLNIAGVLVYIIFSGLVVYVFAEAFS